ncbi:atp4 subunit B of the stator stalk of mitochondrial F1F0 ATP synthase [Polyrhizophydium stewartii]|uniref:ATP synthase subunit 4 n=1 Tax=Polyrhizophydium stewartii TaxID=2732419 RepID=A0ABR4MYM4_9FUNG
MASRFLSTRALVAGLRPSLAKTISARQVAWCAESIGPCRSIVRLALTLAQTAPASVHLHSGLNTAFPLLQQRFQSTEAPKRADPSVVAESLIKVFPGESMAAKSGSVLVAASVAAFLISKEIYIIDAEFLEMLCIFAAFYVWYSNGKDMAVEYFQGRKDAIFNALTKARTEHRAVVQERIDHIGKLSDAVDVTKGLYDISKDIAKLEAEAYELKQKVAFNTEVKSVLDSWVRHEANVREQEQKRLVAHVIEKIKADLSDPKLQQNILNQTLADVEKIAVARR